MNPNCVYYSVVLRLGRFQEQIIEIIRSYLNEDDYDMGWPGSKKRP